MLSLEVEPERALKMVGQWEFVLGMHFSQAVSTIQTQVGIIKDVQVVYSEANPLSKDLEINLRHDGIRLKFDPITQRLKEIEIYNLQLVQLSYGNTIFNSEEVLPTRNQIEATFGATTPGKYVKHQYVLHFRGISFSFPGMFQGSNPQVTMVSIHPGNGDAVKETPPLFLNSTEVYVNGLTVLDDLSLRLDVYTVGPTGNTEGKKEKLTRVIRMGETPQDVQSQLGTPGKVFFKSEDKMKIHSAKKPSGEAVGRTDYFFNYFTLGIDVLFDGRTHRAKKFVLHTNYPGHYNFNIYHRCEFLINLSEEKKKKIDEKKSKCDDKITAYSKWDHITSLINASKDPVVLNRSSSINTKNCFGPSYCYGYKDFIFEVMPNNHIASVTIWRCDEV